MLARGMGNEEELPKQMGKEPAVRWTKTDRERAASWEPRGEYFKEEGVVRCVGKVQGVEN